MSLSKREAIREIEKAFAIPIKKMPIAKDVFKTLEDAVLLIVRAIRTE